MEQKQAAGGLPQTLKTDPRSLHPSVQIKPESIFGRGVYVGENTAQTASVEFVS